MNIVQATVRSRDGVGSFDTRRSWTVSLSIAMSLLSSSIVLMCSFIVTLISIDVPAVLVPIVSKMLANV